MKPCCLLFLLITLCLNVSAQPKIKFNVKHVFVADFTLRKNTLNINRATKAFFEDEKYIVRKTCDGEWGGSIWFKDKRTGIEYSCSATCPVIVNKIKDSYYVTASLTHMSGFSTILEISNPKAMDIFKKPIKKNIVNGKEVIYAGDLESQSQNGTKVLLDSIGVLTLGSFPYKEELYHIVSDRQRTYLATIENRRFIMQEQILDHGLVTYDPEMIKTADGHYVMFFDDANSSGYFDVKGDMITVNIYK